MAQKKWDDLSTKEKARVLREYGKSDPALDDAYNKLTDEQLVDAKVLWPKTYDEKGKVVPWEKQGDALISELAAGRTAGSQPRLKDADAPGTNNAVSDITGVSTGPGGSNVDSYDPLRGLSDNDVKTFSGVRPGSVLQRDDFERTPLGDAALGVAIGQRGELQGRDANRLDVDPRDIPRIDPMMIANPNAIRATSVQLPKDIRASTINPETTDTTDAFRGTQFQVADSRRKINEILGPDGQAGMQNAADMANAAAMGLTPSQAEQMYLGAGAEAATAYDRIAHQAYVDSRNQAGALRRQQQAMAAGQRGSVSGLANLQAMNNSALGEAQLYQQALDTKMRAGIEATGAMTDAQYKAAGARADEMAQARALYAQIETALRSGNIQAAQELGRLAGITLDAEGRVLSVKQDNTNQVNNAITQNVANDLIAQQNTATNRINVGTTNANNDLAGQIQTADNQIQVGTANAANNLTGQIQTADNTRQVIQGNQNTALGVTANDDGMRQAYDGMILGETEADRQANITYGQNSQQVVDNAADRLANTYTGKESRSTAYQTAREDRRAQQTGAVVGAAGTVIGGLIKLSDERSKTVTGSAPTPNFTGAAQPQQSNYDSYAAANRDQFAQPQLSGYQVSPTAIPQGPAQPQQQLGAQPRPRDSGSLAYSLAQPQQSNYASYAAANQAPFAQPQQQAQQLNRMTGNYAPPVPPTDFRRAKDERYTYRNDPTRTQYTGPMAQQLPTNAQTTGPNGQRYVDTGRLAMNLASAVGDIQRRLGV